MSAAFTVSLDSTGFPMIKIPGTQLFMSWLPVTKIQFEHFLCDTYQYDEAWYNVILTDYTPRISPAQIRIADYWNLFMTGVLPSEAIRFANWMGRDYRLPTAHEWKTALTALAQYSDDSEHITAVLNAADPDGKRAINERAALMIRRLDEITPSDANMLTGGRKLCDQMLMRLGVVEFVYENDQHNSFAGWGKPNSRFFGSTFNPLNDNRPIQFVNRTEPQRMRHVGFRLVREVH